MFPRKVFTLDDGALDMKEARFLPNVSLNVQLAPISAPITTGNYTAENNNEHDMDVIDESDIEEDYVSNFHTNLNYSYLFYVAELYDGH